MNKRSIAVAFALALLLVLAFAGAANAGKPTYYWHKADVSVGPVDSDMDLWAGAIAVGWTEPATVPYGYTIYLDGPTSYSVSVPGWAPRPIRILGSYLSPGRYKVLLVAYDADHDALDRLRGSFVYPLD